jgi:hypothetical protein
LVLSFRSFIFNRLPSVAKLLHLQRFSTTQKIINVFSFAVVTFYTLLISTVLQPFDCTKQIDGSYTLTYAPAFKCFDSVWSYNLAAVIFFVLLYVVAIPICMCWIFWRHRGNINSSKFISKYSLLVSSYKPRFFYFELANMLKKALFVISTGVLSSSQDVKYSLSIVTFMIFLLVKAILLPYQTRKTNTVSNL